MLGATSSRSQRAIWARSLPVRSPSCVCVRPARRRASRIRLPATGTGLLHDPAHDAVPQALGADVVKAGPLVEGAGGVVEHGHLLAVVVVRVALDDPAADLCDQIDRTAKR